MNASLRSFAVGAPAVICSSAAAAAIDSQAVVGTFKAICFDPTSPLQAAEDTARTKGWSKDERLSGQQSSLASQSVMTHTWDIPSADTPLSITISTIETGPDRKEMCAVLARRFSDTRGLESSFVSELQLTSPKRRSSGREDMSQWDLGGPKDGFVWIFSQRLADGVGVQLGIARDR